MIVLAEPDPDDMVQAIAKAIHILPQIDPQDMHLRVSFFSPDEIPLQYKFNFLCLLAYLSDEKPV